MNDNNKYTKEEAFKVLNSINAWIKSSDTKTSILMTFITLLFGFSFTFFDSLKYLSMPERSTTISAIIIFLLIIYIVSAIIAIIFCSLSLRGRIKHKKSKTNSLFFFGDIAKLTEDDFISKTATISDNEILTDLKKQIYINSKIARLKLIFFNLGLLVTFIQFCTSICLLLIIKIAIA